MTTDPKQVDEAVEGQGLIERGRKAWNFIFYPKREDFYDDDSLRLKTDRMLEIGDCLRLALDELESLSTLRSQHEALVGACGPFIGVVESWVEDEPDQTEITSMWVDGTGDVPVTLGDFRALCQALNPTQPND